MNFGNFGFRFQLNNINVQQFSFIATFNQMEQNKETSRSSSISNLTINRRFQRSIERNNSLQKNRSLSMSSSQPQLHNFYTKFANTIKKKGHDSPDKSQISIDEVLFSNIKKKIELPLLKSKSIQRKEKEDFQNQIKRLKQRNQQLQLKLKQISKSMENQLNKQNKSMNRMKEKTQKQRLRELQSQNKSFRSIIQKLKSQLKDLKCSKLTEETSSSILSNHLDLQSNDQLLPNIQEHFQNNEKKIFNLNETVKKLQLEMNFLNRRNHSEIVVIKNSYEKQFKTIKDKFAEILKENSELKKKNIELAYKIKGKKQKKCKCFKWQCSGDMSDDNSLSLSCSD